MSKVTIVDYNLGNLFNVQRAFEAVGADVVMTQDPFVIRKAACLVLPGVGAFADGMKNLEQLGLVVPIQEYLSRGRPFLGICLGMQMLFERSLEFGDHRGLGFFAGTVAPIPPHSDNGESLRVPHVGWNEIRGATLDSNWDDSALATTQPGTCFYFVHSFAALVSQSRQALATTQYGGHQLIAVVRRDRVIGCQFHPERSGPAGLNILRTYVDQSMRNQH